MMKVAVIGSGNVGDALTRRFANAGHSVTIGTRNPEDPELNSIEIFPNITVRSIAEAVAVSEVIVVATPAHVAVELAAQLGNLEGKVLIDATNAVQKKPEPYPTAFDAFKALTAAECVKCFNTTGFENMQNPFYNNVAIDMFMAGSSPRGKQVARQLALAAGFAECYDFGGDDKVQLLEYFALSWINLAIMQGHGRNMAFKVLKR
jgi:8-hydroxy-5-deazaflavin:NADPH oxidoreductase